LFEITELNEAFSLHLRLGFPAQGFFLLFVPTNFFLYSPLGFPSFNAVSELFPPPPGLSLTPPPPGPSPFYFGLIFFTVFGCLAGFSFSPTLSDFP